MKSAEEVWHENGSVDSSLKTNAEKGNFLELLLLLLGTLTTPFAFVGMILLCNPDIKIHHIALFH